jgi:hypothetical protein
MGGEMMTKNSRGYTPPTRKEIEAMKNVPMNHDGSDHRTLIIDMALALEATENALYHSTDLFDNVPTSTDGNFFSNAVHNALDQALHDLEKMKKMLERVRYFDPGEEQPDYSVEEV